MQQRELEAIQSTIKSKVEANSSRIETIESSVQEIAETLRNASPSDVLQEVKDFRSSVEERLPKE